MLYLNESTSKTLNTKKSLSWLIANIFVENKSIAIFVESYKNSYIESTIKLI